MDVQEQSGMRFAVTLPHGVTPREARVLGVAGTLALCRALDSDARIMWPGRVLVDDSEIAEAAFRMSADAVEIMYYVNRSGDEPAMREAVERELAALTADFPQNSADIVQAYCNRCGTLMKYVDTAYRGMPVYGFAFAVDKYGGLMVMTRATRTVVTIYSGRAELAQDEPQQPDYPIMPHV